MTSRSTFHRICGLSALVALGAIACGGSSDKGAVGIEHVTPPRTIVKRPIPRTQRLFAAGVNDRLLGPFVARGARGKNVVAWVDSGDNATRRIRALVTDDAGIAIQPARDLVSAAGDVTSLVVKRAGGEAATVLAWTTLGERGEILRVMGVGDDAAVASAPVDVARSNEDIVWVEVIPTRSGAVVLWAEETREGKANVLGITVDGRGHARSVPSFLARGVVGWHATAADSGAALALLSDPGKKKDGSQTFALSLLRIDEEGRAVAAPIPVAADAQPDFEMARALGGHVFAWTDKTGLEPQVKAVVVDDRGRIAPVERIGAPIAGSRLVALAPLTKGALLAYEEPTNRQRVSRRVVLTRIGGTTQAATVIEIEGKGPPEITATVEGAVVLGRMRVCDKSEKDDTCSSSSFAPAALELDAELGQVRAERIQSGDPAEDVSLAWGLACAPSCASLALGSPEPEGGRPVLAAPLFTRPTQERVVLAALYAKGRPRPRSFLTVLRTEPVAEVALARSSGAVLSAVLTRGEEGPATKGASASLYLVPSDKEGKSASALPLSTRASAAGGVSMATAPDGSIVVAWVSREEGGARVKLTRVSAAGKKLGDVWVTTRKGDVSFVNVAPVEGGFVVAWIDTRDGQGEVYAAKVSTDLARVNEHQRLTNAPGDASDLAIVSHPSGNVWLAWSDPRESPKEGTGDIYAMSIRAKDARKASDEIRVLASAAHSRSPSLAPSGDGVAIGWIEEAPIGVEAEGHAAYGAMLTWLDARGHATREAIRLRGAGSGAPIGIALDAAKGGARGLLVRSQREELALDAFTLEDGGRVVSSWLLSPEGPPTLDLALSLDGSDALFAEEGRSASEHRVRRLSIAWPD